MALAPASRVTVMESVFDHVRVVLEKGSKAVVVCNLQKIICSKTYEIYDDFYAYTTGG